MSGQYHRPTCTKPDGACNCVEKKWCKHIVWMYKEWEFYYRGECACFVTLAWKVCPICLAKRPTKTNIAAAKLQAEMDGDL